MPIAYRIADSRHAIFEATGAMVHGGRWNSPGHPVIYAAETYSGAVLEILAHLNGISPPKHHRLVRIRIPDHVTVETIHAADIPGWDSENLHVSRRLGDRWIAEKRTAVLRVPSIVTAGNESNFVFNPAHPEFAHIVAGEPEPVIWDSRLFGRVLSSKSSAS